MSVTIFRHRKRQWIVQCEHSGEMVCGSLEEAKRFAESTLHASGKWRRRESAMTWQVRYEEVTE